MFLVVIYDSKWRVILLWTVSWTKEQMENVALGVYLNIEWHFIDLSFKS